MGIRDINETDDIELDLRHLRVFEMLIREANLTRTAQILNVTQPAVSRTLTQLRRYFSDPLFIRAGNGMAPTAKAIELKPAVRRLLDQATMLRAKHVPFDPGHSTRNFRFSVLDAGLVKLLPPLIDLLRERAPNVSLTVLPAGTDDIETALETGELDFAMGSYRSLTKRIRRQRLFSTSYVSAVRCNHPRLRSAPSFDAFCAEMHVLASAASTGHAHRAIERAIEKAVPRRSIVCRVPSFITAAVVASMSDAVVTLPVRVVEPLAERLRLRVFEPPLELPRIDVSQYWHQRFHKDAGNRWIRDVFMTLFGANGSRANTQLDRGA
jgi:DNA-binding transcriptional LysR family regulator